ncbi:hypothetical protein D3C81_874760 [compost metagenome]
MNVGFEKRIFGRDHLHGHRVDAQFLGHASSQSRVCAGAGIVLVHHQFHGAVGQDPHPGVGFEFACRCRGFRVRRSQARRQVKRNRQTASHGRGLLEKDTPREIDLRIHHHASFDAEAARLIALLMRPYVPQRHRLPDMALRIESSVTAAPVLSSAAADMI